MLYYCRGCNTPMITGSQSCSACGSIFDKPVPEVKNRETFDSHKIVLWPPRDPTIVEKAGMSLYTGFLKLPMPVRFVVVLFGLGLMVQRAIYDSQHQVKHEAPTLTISQIGTSYDQMADSDIGLGDTGNSATDPSGSAAAVSENPNAPLSSEEKFSVQHELKGMSAMVSAGKLTVPRNDAIAAKAADQLTASQQAELQAELSSVAGEMAASEGASNGHKGKHGASPVDSNGVPTGKLAHLLNHGVSSETASMNDEAGGADHDSTANASPSQASAPVRVASTNGEHTPTGKSVEIRISTGSVPVNQIDSGQPAPTDAHQAASPAASTQPSAVAKQVAAPAYRPSKALIRLKHVYLGAQEHFEKFDKNDDDSSYVLSHQSEPKALARFVHEAVLVYPRLQISERTEWKQDLVAMLIWKIEVSDTCKTVEDLNTPPPSWKS